MNDGIKVKMLAFRLDLILFTMVPSCMSFQMNEVKWEDDSDTMDSQRVVNIVNFDYEAQKPVK